MENETQNQKLQAAQKKVEDLLKKEFPGCSCASFLFVTKLEGNNASISFSSKANFDKSAPLVVWQAYATGLQNHFNGVLNDFKPPELVAMPQKPVDRAMT